MTVVGETKRMDAQGSYANLYAQATASDAVAPPHGFAVQPANRLGLSGLGAVSPARNGLLALQGTLRAHERKTPARSLWAKIFLHPFASSLFALGVLSGSVIAGLVAGGQFQGFITEHGTLGDGIASTLGFGLASISIEAGDAMSTADILKASKIDSTSSLLFLNVSEVRNNLLTLPVVKDAKVRKFYPSQLDIVIEERQPFALWQKDGDLNLVAEDGTPIGPMQDARFTNLPFVVGEGANLRVADFAALLTSAGDLRARIRAGVWVAGRRWNIKMSNNVDVWLPEQDPQTALAVLNEVERTTHILEKDILAIDFRVPGRLFVRLSEEAADERANALAIKKRGKGPV